MNFFSLKNKILFLFNVIYIFLKYEISLNLFYKLFLKYKLY